MRGRWGNERDERPPGSQHSLAQQWQCGREIVFLNMHGFWLNERLRKVMIIVHARTKGNIYWLRREMRGQEEERDERPGRG